MSALLHIAVSLLPVGFFLAALILIDSYKLVRARSIFLSLVVGALAAGLSYLLNSYVLSRTGMSVQVYSRYGAPFIEEFLKGIFVGWLIATNRVGFTVDAAIQGFAVGAGFAVVENVYYLSTVINGSLQIWIIRGLGTAVMHGGTMTVFAILAKSLSGGSRSFALRPLLIAFAGAFGLHSIYNHFPLPPIVGTAVLLITFPLIIGALFQESEKRTRSWLGSGFDTDQELLKLIISGAISDTRIGEYLKALRDNFEGPIVADMLCLIRMRVELSIRAKGMLMMRKAGFKVAPDESLKRKFKELRYLESSIGRTGLLAIEPIHRWTRREIWQLNMLGEGGTDKPSK